MLVNQNSGEQIKETWCRHTARVRINDPSVFRSSKKNTGKVLEVCVFDTVFSSPKSIYTAWIFSVLLSLREATLIFSIAVIT